jgi:acyl carrier protein
MLDETLIKVLQAVEQVFGREVGAQEDFFSCGGDSLTGVELVLLLEELLGVEVDVSELLEAEDFRTLAELLSGTSRADPARRIWSE